MITCNQEIRRTLKLPKKSEFRRKKMKVKIEEIKNEDCKSKNSGGGTQLI